MFSPAAYCKLECSIPRQELAATPVWVQTVSLQSVACLHCIHSGFSCISFFSLNPVDLWDDFHLLLVQEFKTRTILIAAGTLSLPLCHFP